MAKIKCTFTDEHIALIKALNFEQIDLFDIIKCYNTFDNVEKVVVRDIDDKEKSIPTSDVQYVTIGELMYKNNLTSIDGIYGFDTYNLWGGTYLLEQMALILGYADKAIPESIEEPTGPRYPDEITEHLKDLDVYIIGNLKNIISIMLQFCTEGIQPNVTYWSYDYQNIWHKE